MRAVCSIITLNLPFTDLWASAAGKSCVAAAALLADVPMGLRLAVSRVLTFEESRMPLVLLVESVPASTGHGGHGAPTGRSC